MGPGLGEGRRGNRIVNRQWTTEQVLALAPDDGSVKAGKGLARKDKWVTLGHDDRAAWGECKGSGAKPYQTRIDLSEPAFRCSCPSRKFPCKHGLGLFLLLVGESEAFTRGEPPAWVGEWLGSREQRKQKQAERASKPPKPPDPKAQAKRVADRREKIGDGLAELETKLRDVVRGGLAAAQSQPYSFWDAAAKRLVDAQAVGAARMVRDLAAAASSKQGWAEALLARMGRLKLLGDAFSRLESLPAQTQDDLRAHLGWPISKEEVLAGPGLSDHWLVFASTLEEDEEARLQVQSVWLWGRQTRRAALVLNFAHRSQPLDLSLQPGMGLDGELVYCPGSVPLRALVLRREGMDRPFKTAPGHETIDAALKAFAQALAKNPWLERFPMVLQNVTPTRKGKEWLLVDDAANTVPLLVRDQLAWELLAQSGGRPMTVFGEWIDGTLMPLPTVANYNPPTQTPTPRPSILLSELARMAMLGGERRQIALPRTNGALGAMLDKLDAAADPEGALLTAAGLISVYQQAGQVPIAFEEPLPDPSRPETQPVCSPGAAALLDRMLNGKNERVIDEWIGLAVDAGQVAPPRLTPSLLDHGTRNPELRERTKRVAGQLGRWLAGFDPRWDYTRRDAGGTETENTATWEEGTRAERKAFLRDMRARDPEAARELLSKCFGNEPARERAEFLEQFLTGLSLEDEPFLEQALDDKRQNVRQTAARLLAALDGSALAGRMVERLRPLVCLERKMMREKLAVEYPESCDKAMQRDGIKEKKPSDADYGQKAWWLAQVVSLTPLGFWPSHLSKSIPELLDMVRKSEWAAPLLDGMTDAAIHRGDESWLRPLLDLAKHKKSTIDSEALFAALSPSAREAFLIDVMRGDSAKGRDFIFTYGPKLALCPSPWNDEIGRLVLPRMREFVKSTKKGHYDWEMRGFLKSCATSLSKSLLRESLEGWDTQSFGWEYFTKGDDSFYTVFQFRNQLHEEFTP